MFPNPDYALPIFGTDLVGRGGGSISAAIADLSPVNGDRTLPQRYQQSLSRLSKVEFSQPRALPNWDDIFSDFCLFMHPVNGQEEKTFLNRVREFLTLHCQIAMTEKPLTCTLDITNVLAGQQYYCMKQQQNDKTRRVLEKSFGAECELFGT